MAKMQSVWNVSNLLLKTRMATVSVRMGRCISLRPMNVENVIQAVLNVLDLAILNAQSAKMDSSCSII